MLVNQRLWKINNQIHSQCHNQFHSQFPQFEWVDHQAREPDPEYVQERVKRTQMFVKRNVSDSQRAEARKGKVKMWKNWQRRRKNNILMLMLGCLHKTWRVEYVVGDAADAAPEQMNILLDAREQSMNSFVQSKTDVTQTTVYGRRSQR